MKIFKIIIKDDKMYCIDVLGRKKKNVIFGELKNNYTEYDGYYIPNGLLKPNTGNAMGIYVLAIIIASIITLFSMENVLHLNNFTFSMIYMIVIGYIGFLVFVAVFALKYDSKEFIKNINKVEHEKVVVKLESDIAARRLNTIGNIFYIFAIIITFIWLHMAFIGFRNNLILLIGTPILLSLSIYKYLSAIPPLERFNILRIN